ncbi:MAG: site-specific integrase [Prevotellaceae bacterium]|jgi:site-specific recombinase XerD|nr:site-specific integrase [Prevotellaceae bacterium]
MAKVSVIRYTSKVLQDGSSPIMLRISKGNSKRKYFALGFSASAKQWDDVNGCFVRDKRVNRIIYGEDEHGKKIQIDGYEVNNAFIERKRIKAKEIIDKFDQDDIDWTFAMFEEKFINESKKILVVEYLQHHIKKLKEEKRYGNARVYHHLTLIFDLFQKDKKIRVDKLYFQDFGYDMVNKFYLYMKNDRELSGNTMSYYLRTLRSLMNFAIKDGCGSKEVYCFSNEYSDTKNIFNINSLQEETKKRYLPKDSLSIIKNTIFDREPLEYSRRLFLLSFYLYGISYIDLAKLKKSDINYTITKDGRQIKVINYKRSKTHKSYSIPVRSEIQEQLDWFYENYPTVGDYLLPCVTRDLKDEALNEHIINRRKKYNGYLKEIAKELEFPESLAKISTYYSRHSYAMAMLGSGASVEVIQQALGHEDMKTTRVYLDSFDDDLIAKQSDGLI